MDKEPQLHQYEQLPGEDTSRKKRMVPLGLPRKPETEETLPAIEVVNQVDWVNEKIKAPFNLKVGEQAKIGAFYNPKGKEGLVEKFVPARFKNKTHKMQIEARPGHGRSGIIGQVIFEDVEGNTYRDVDVKGLGYSDFEVTQDGFVAVIKKLEIFEEGTLGAGREVYGLLDLPAARYDAEMAEAFLNAGIRSDRVIAIIKLRELVDDKGKKVSIEDAKTKGMISQAIKPVLEVRAYKTKSRVGEYVHPVFEELKEKAIEDARIIVAEELRRNPDSFSLKEYLSWFAIELGKNMALIHKNGWYYGRLSNSGRGRPDNVTLDCRITDRDSVGFLDRLNQEEKNGKIEGDLYNCKEVLSGLFQMCLPSLRKFYTDEKIFKEMDTDSLIRIFQEEYKKILSQN